jgi:hypothetical protein
MITRRYGTLPIHGPTLCQNKPACGYSPRRGSDGFPLKRQVEVLDSPRTWRSPSHLHFYNTQPLSFTMNTSPPPWLFPPQEPLFRGNPQDPDNPIPNEDLLPVFQWAPPDLSKGSTWYNERVHSLWKAVLSLPDPEKFFQEGLKLLPIHQGNNVATGPSPKRLQFLWWEFPPEHWTPLREGSPMNFLVEPAPWLNKNAHMDAEQLDIAASFIDELLELHIFRTFGDGKAFMMNAPLFVAPKEGQEGEWRVIADMLRGGQNACMGSDPVSLPRSNHILNQIYQGGYSAVVDASKFFNQFTTHPDNHPFLGLLHPVTGIMYTYGGLPMGAGSSPCLAGRYGLSLLRLLREECKLFQGAPRANCYWTGFSEIGFDPALGYGFVLESSDGPAVKVWVWIDDFLLHGPTFDKTTRAPKFFLNLSVCCGMLCHPKKLTPQSQVVKYCGFLFDTTGIPCL